MLPSSSSSSRHARWATLRARTLDVLTLHQSHKFKYRTLDKKTDEIRLLRILPSTQDPCKRTSHEPATDIIVCQLEHESLDVIAKDRKRRQEATKIDDAMERFYMSRLGLGYDQNPLALFARLAQQRKLNETLVKHKLNKRSEADYHIDSERLQMLYKEYSESFTTIASWLPRDYRHLMSSAMDFEHWLQNLVWSPLSQHPDHAENIGLGYYALSYTWSESRLPLYNGKLRMLLKLAEASSLSMKDLLKDDEAPKQLEIIIDGRIVNVGENLYAALRTLREIPEIRNGARVWIDALCIDQTNEDERSKQVKKMDRIYRGADRVISYLGSADNHANEVLQAMEMIGYGKCDEEAADELRSWIQAHHDSPFFHYFSLLMSKGYWRRIWVMQELALASETSILICGMKRYDLVPGLFKFGIPIAHSTHDLFIAPRAMPIGRANCSSINDLQPTMTMGTLLDGLARLKNISELRDLVETNKDRLQIFNTLWFRTAAENNATDPRDLVYGMLALLPAKLAQGVQIRYGTTTYQQVAINFAVNHMQTYNSLHWILFHPWHSFRDSQDWPSWVPNLGLPFNSAKFWSTIGSWQACSNIDAAGELFQNEGTLLHCQGFKYDVICTTTTPLFQEPEPSVQIWEKLPDILAAFAKESNEEGMKYLNELWPDLRSLDHATSCKERTQDDDATTRKRSITRKEGSDHRYKSQQGFQDAFLACLQQLKLTTPDEAEAIFTIPINLIHDAALYQAGGFSSATKSAFISSRDTRIAYLSHFLRRNQDFSLDGAKLADCFEGPCSDKEAAEYVVEDKFPSFEALDGMIPRMDRTSQVARMFTTGLGYLGVAIGEIQAGDEIYILKGCCMPVALRPSSRYVGAYQFLGGVFVHGIMHGEAVIDYQSRSGNLHRVTLC